MAIEHDGGITALVPTRVVAEWPPGTFLENLAVLPDGAIAVTVHSERAIDRVDPRTGAVHRLATAPVPLAGLAVGPDGTLWASGGIPGTPPGSIWRLVPGGTPDLWLELPDAVFLNGMTWLAEGALLVADSFAGCIFRVSTTERRSDIWLASDMLRPASAGPTPGANGVGLSGRSVMISVTDRNLLLTAPVDGVGRPGALSVLAERLRADDFAVGPDGDLFIATHPANSVMRLSPAGARRTLATAAEGAVNPTSAAFGVGQESGTLYVTTTGGVVAPLPGGLQPARLLRLDTGFSAGGGGQLVRWDAASRPTTSVSSS